MAVTITVKAQDNYNYGHTAENVNVTISTGTTELFLTRSEALYLVATLGKRLMQLSGDPDMAVLNSIVDGAIDEARTGFESVA